ncbi:hypothetical protein H1R20_g2341, partial [Candolleomyces eurysporus]
MLLTKVVTGRASKLTFDEAMDSAGNDVPASSFLLMSEASLSPPKLPPAVFTPVETGLFAPVETGLAPLPAVEIGLVLSPVTETGLIVLPVFETGLALIHPTETGLAVFAQPSSPASFRPRICSLYRERDVFRELLKPHAPRTQPTSPASSIITRSLALFGRVRDVLVAFFEFLCCGLYDMGPYKIATCIFVLTWACFTLGDSGDPYAGRFTLPGFFIHLRAVGPLSLRALRWIVEWSENGMDILAQPIRLEPLGDLRWFTFPTPSFSLISSIDASLAALKACWSDRARPHLVDAWDFLVVQASPLPVALVVLGLCLWAVRVSEYAWQVPSFADTVSRLALALATRSRLYALVQPFLPAMESCILAGSIILPYVVAAIHELMPVVAEDLWRKERRETWCCPGMQPRPRPKGFPWKLLVKHSWRVCCAYVEPRLRRLDRRVETEVLPALCAALEYLRTDAPVLAKSLWTDAISLVKSLPTGAKSLWAKTKSLWAEAKSLAQSLWAEAKSLAQSLWTKAESLARSLWTRTKHLRGLLYFVALILFVLSKEALVFALPLSFWQRYQEWKEWIQVELNPMWGYMPYLNVALPPAIQVIPYQYRQPQRAERLPVPRPFQDTTSHVEVEIPEGTSHVDPVPPALCEDAMDIDHAEVEVPAGLCANVIDEGHAEVVATFGNALEATQFCTNATEEEAMAALDKELQEAFGESTSHVELVAPEPCANTTHEGHAEVVNTTTLEFPQLCPCAVDEDEAAALAALDKELSEALEDQALQFTSECDIFTPLPRRPHDVETPEWLTTRTPPPIPYDETAPPTPFTLPSPSPSPEVQEFPCELDRIVNLSISEPMTPPTPTPLGRLPPMNLEELKPLKVEESAALITASESQLEERSSTPSPQYYPPTATSESGLADSRWSLESTGVEDYSRAPEIHTPPPTPPFIAQSEAELFRLRERVPSPPSFDYTRAPEIHTPPPTPPFIAQSEAELFRLRERAPSPLSIVESSTELVTLRDRAPSPEPASCSLVTLPSSSSSVGPVRRSGRKGKLTAPKAKTAKMIKKMERVAFSVLEACEKAKDFVGRDYGYPIEDRPAQGRICMEEVVETGVAVEVRLLVEAPPLFPSMESIEQDLVDIAVLDGIAMSVDDPEEMLPNLLPGTPMELENWR